MDGPGDGGAVDAVEDRQSRVRKLEPQDHQGGDHPIGENQLMAGPAAFGPQTLVTSTFTQPRVLPRHPWASQFGDERAKSTPRDASADTMRESRTGQGRRHNLPNPYGSLQVTTRRSRFSETAPLVALGGEQFQVCAGGATVGIDLPVRSAHPLGTAERASLKGARDPPREPESALSGVLDEARL